MAVQPEEVKAGIQNPFLIRERLEAVSREGFSAFTEEELFLLGWWGLTPHREEPARFMLRLGLPGGVLNPAQLKEVAQWAKEPGPGFADITTRQDLQLHGVEAAQIQAVLERFEAVGLSSQGMAGDTLRNVVGCPVAAVHPEAPFDPTELLAQVQAAFRNNPELTNLPRKLKVSIASCPDQCQQPELHCLSFVGTSRPQGESVEHGFDLWIGGGLSSQWRFAEPLGTFLLTDQVLPTLEAIARLYAQASELRTSRDQARFKHWVASLGVEPFRVKLQEVLSFELPVHEAESQPSNRYRDHVGVHAQKQEGLFAAGIPVPAGRLTAEQMLKVADLAERYCSGGIRLTPRQNLMLLNLPSERVAQVLEGCEGVGLKIDASPIARGLMACSGKQFCRLGETETKARAQEILGYLQQKVLLDEPIRIHLSGCASACAQSPVAHIGLQGTTVELEGQSVEAFDVSVGGELGPQRAFNRVVLQAVPAAQLKVRLEQLLVEYKKTRTEQETFNQFCLRVGDEAVAALLSGEPEPAA